MNVNNAFIEDYLGIVNNETEKNMHTKDWLEDKVDETIEALSYFALEDDALDIYSKDEDVLKDELFISARVSYIYQLILEKRWSEIDFVIEPYRIEKEELSNDVPIHKGIEEILQRTFLANTNIYS